MLEIIILNYLISQAELQDLSVCHFEKEGKLESQCSVREGVTYF